MLTTENYPEDGSDKFLWNFGTTSKATRPHNLEDNNLHIQENLKSEVVKQGHSHFYSKLLCKDRVSVLFIG
jgi:hypothetical protein